MTDNRESRNRDESESLFSWLADEAVNVSHVFPLSGTQLCHYILQVKFNPNSLLTYVEFVDEILTAGEGIYWNVRKGDGNDDDLTTATSGPGRQRLPACPIYFVWDYLLQERLRSLGYTMTGCKTRDSLARDRVDFCEFCQHANAETIPGIVVAMGLVPGHVAETNMFSELKSRRLADLDSNTAPETSSDEKTSNGSMTFTTFQRSPLPMQTGRTTSLPPRGTVGTNDDPLGICLDEDDMVVANLPGGSTTPAQQSPLPGQAGQTTSLQREAIETDSGLLATFSDEEGGPIVCLAGGSATPTPTQQSPPSEQTGQTTSFMSRRNTFEIQRRGACTPDSTIQSGLRVPQRLRTAETMASKARENPARENVLRVNDINVSYNGGGFWIRMARRYMNNPGELSNLIICLCFGCIMLNGMMMVLRYFSEILGTFM